MWGLLHPLEWRSGWLWPGGERRGRGTVFLQAGADADVRRGSPGHWGTGGQTQLWGGGWLRLVVEDGPWPWWRWRWRGQGRFVVVEGGHTVVWWWGGAWGLVRAAGRGVEAWLTGGCGGGRRVTSINTPLVVPAGPRELWGPVCWGPGPSASTKLRGEPGVELEVGVLVMLVLVVSVAVGRVEGRVGWWRWSGGLRKHGQRVVVWHHVTVNTSVSTLILNTVSARLINLANPSPRVRDTSRPSSRPAPPQLSPPIRRRRTSWREVKAGAVRAQNSGLARLLDNLSLIAWWPLKLGEEFNKSF